MEHKSHLRFFLLATLLLFVPLFFVQTTQLVQSSALRQEDVVTVEAVSVDLTPTSASDVNAPVTEPTVELTATPEPPTVDETIVDVTLLTFKNYLAFVSSVDENIVNGVKADSTPAPQIEPSPEPTTENEGADDAGRIVGGVEATRGAWPWQARLSITIGSRSFLCGGSLVDANWVLTAAHCLRDGGTTAAPNGVTVILGDHTRSVAEVDEQIIGVTQVIIHPSYNASTDDNDIALLRLRRAAILTNRVRVIPLVSSPQNDALFAAGVTASITGWGSTVEGGSSVDTLRQAQVPIVANATCNAPNSYNGIITANMLCAGRAQGGIDTCQGDSGGPLSVRDGASWRLAGITSWGIGCARANLYGVYTRVARYTAWVNGYISRQGTFQLVALHSNKCLDVAGGTGATANGTNVQQWECVGAQQINQVWRLIPVGNVFQVVADHSGKCLDVTGGTGAVGNGTNVQQWQCLGAAQTNQLWRLVPVGNAFQLVAVHSGKCLDVAGGTGATANGTNVQQWQCLGAAQTNQLWQLVPFGSFQVVAQHSGKCLDVAGGTGAVGNGTNVQQWGCIGASQTNQLWRLVRVSMNRFQVMAAHSGKCLDVAGGTGATANGTNVQQWDCIGTGQTNQLWRLVPVGSRFQLIAIHSGRCLDVAGGTGATANGTNVQQWACIGASQTNQLWELRRP